MRAMPVLAAPILILAAASAGPLPAQDTRPAQGFAFWVQSGGGTVQELAASITGAPRFAVGFRRERVRFGIGLGVIRVKQTERNDLGGGASSKDENTAFVFQVGPTLVRDVWSSSDGRTRGTLGVSAGVGRLSITERNEFTDPSGTTVTQTKTTGTLVGFQASLGGDHFLHPHFALGGEAGLQGSFGLGLEQQGAPGRSFGLNAAGSYAALRVTVVF